MKHKEGFSQIAVILIAIGIVVIGGAIWYFSSRGPAVIPTPISQNETEGWQTYTTSSYGGFSFKYPANLTIAYNGSNDTYSPIVWTVAFSDGTDIELITKDAWQQLASYEKNTILVSPSSTYQFNYQQFESPDGSMRGASCFETSDESVGLLDANFIVEAMDMNGNYIFVSSVDLISDPMTDPAFSALDKQYSELFMSTSTDANMRAEQFKNNDIVNYFNSPQARQDASSTVKEVEQIASSVHFNQ